ncbi:PREDICTED: nascent polypeptide-associated complex subunit alpha, muscle-specific form [Cercocebus atys]|uniref:nascent polypeptide-associated complex subunit alpha, muscle-specific form n=1 Tax=Cercocebus atys TaxID=9531 RepID=UPI0005F4802A|nr:PREDICTED: nascent polypeptide-associated complex subunit alpha, muscle-specific form [Cercocebus atys]
MQANGTGIFNRAKRKCANCHGSLPAEKPIQAGGRHPAFVLFPVLSPTFGPSEYRKPGPETRSGGGRPTKAPPGAPSWRGHRAHSFAGLGRGPRNPPADTRGAPAPDRPRPRQEKGEATARPARPRPTRAPEAPAAATGSSRGAHSPAPRGRNSAPSHASSHRDGRGGPLPAVSGNPTRSRHHARRASRALARPDGHAHACALATRNGPERVSERLKEAVLLSVLRDRCFRRPPPGGPALRGPSGMGTGAVGPRRRDGAGGTLAWSPPGTALDVLRSLQNVHGSRPCAHRLLLSFQLSSGCPSPPASALRSSPASALLFHPPGPSSPPSSPSTPNLASVVLQACTSTVEREKDRASSPGPPLNQGPNLKGPRHPTPNAYFPPSLSRPWDTTRLSQLAFSFSFCVHGACVRKRAHSKCGFWMRPPPALPAMRFPSLGSLHQTGNPCLPTLLSPSHFTCPRHSRRPLFLALDAPGSCCILPAPA